MGARYDFAPHDLNVQMAVKQRDLVPCRPPVTVAMPT